MKRTRPLPARRVAAHHRRGIVGYTARKDREVQVLRIMEALRSRVVNVGRSFRNANRSTMVGRPISLGEPG